MAVVLFAVQKDLSRIAPLSFILRSITNYSSDSCDPTRSYSFPHLPDVTNSPLSFTNPLNSLENELTDLFSSDWLANQHRFSSLLQGCHPSALHSVQSPPPAKSPVHTLPSTGQRSALAAMHIRRRSSPVLHSKIMHQLNPTLEGSPAVSVIPAESGSDSSGSSGQGSPNRSQQRRSLPHPPGGSPAKQKAATIGSVALLFDLIKSWVWQ